MKLSRYTANNLLVPVRLFPLDPSHGLTTVGHGPHIGDLRERIRRLESKTLRKLVAEVLVGHDIEIILCVLKVLRNGSLSGYGVWRLSQHRVAKRETVIAYLRYMEQHEPVRSAHEPYAKSGRRRYSIAERGAALLNVLSGERLELDRQL